jgi:type IV pilus assembly protein PilC
MRFIVTIRKEGAPDETRTIEAATRFAVYDHVQAEGSTVVSITEKSGLHLPGWLNITIGTGVKRIEIVRFTKNLSAMLSAGLSLARALAVIERQSSNKALRTIVTNTADTVKRGEPFHTALAAYPHVFPNLLVSMVRAGEESGSLADALRVVGVQMERSEELTRKVRGAMIYPSIVLVAIVIVAVLMLIFVVPTLTSTFEQLGVQLPLATRIIVAVSNFLMGNVLAVGLGAAVFIVAAGLFLRSERGKAVVLFVGLHTPVVSEIVRETYSARTARTLSSLLSSGVSILDALAITRDVVHASVFARVITEAEERVKKGEPLSAPFAANTKVYPILLGDMLMVGEETGKITDMLLQIAEFYEADVSEKTKDLSTIIEPILMLFIGAVVGVFAVSIIGPIYSLSSAI